MDRDEPVSPVVSLVSGEVAAMSKNERLKTASQGLFFVAGPKGEIHAFGSEIDALTQGEVETLSNEAKELSKFFGIYKQQARGERGKKTDDYFFMVRIKAPAGGDFSPEQWTALDEAAEKFADGTLRITSRQGIQYHHVYGPKLAPLVRFLNRNYRDAATLGACGDVNRNVMCSPIEGLDPEHPTGGQRARGRDRRGAGAALERLLPGVPLRPGGAQPRADQLRRAAVRRALPAAQVQDRDRAPERQLDRRADTGRRLRPGREGRTGRREPLGSLQRRRARHDAQQPAHRARCSGSTWAGSGATRWSRRRARSRSSRRSTASGRTAGRRAGSTRSAGSASRRCARS